eukprot:gene7869-5496_t
MAQVDETTTRHIFRAVPKFPLSSCFSALLPNTPGRFFFITFLKKSVSFHMTWKEERCSYFNTNDKKRILMWIVIHDQFKTNYHHKRVSETPTGVMLGALSLHDRIADLIAVSLYAFFISPLLFFFVLYLSSSLHSFTSFLSSFLS